MLRSIGSARADGKAIVLGKAMVGTSREGIVPGSLEYPCFDIVEHDGCRNSAEPFKCFDMAGKEHFLRLAEDDRTVCLAGVSKTGGEYPRFSYAFCPFIFDETEKPKVHVHAIAGNEGSCDYRLGFGRA